MKKKILISIITFIGFILTVKLAIIYYESNFNPYALSSFCSINDYIDCDGVAKTTASQFFGIPLAYWGMFLYLFIGLLLIVDKLKNIRFLNILSVFKRPMDYISALGFISVVVSMLLAFKSVFILQKICILCFVTYILNTLIALIATDFNNDGFLMSFKNSFEDFVSGVKKYPLQFLAVVVIGLSFLAYTTLANPFTPQVKEQKSIKSFMEMKTNPYSVSGNDLGNPKSSKRVELYTDYACPMCFAYNIMIHKAVKELGDIYIESHNLPLDKECNKYLRKQVHRNACRFAKYALAAKAQGKYWDMVSLLFETKPKNDEEAVLLAEKIGLDTEEFKRCIESSDTMKKIKDDIDFAVQQGVVSTPTIVVNGKRYVGIKPYYELIEILKKD